ncbi:acyltransferase [Yinghuangia aomiensis]|uniref:Acyltransferase n=1 Tax=Yinghuangia aomiensis TaxID=676205 RepID=A0ABP9GTH7_9ACTN
MTGKGGQAPRDRESGPRTARAHLTHVDLMRVVAFLAVVLVHASGTTYPFPGAAPSFGQLMLHSMRMVFFFVSTFVLFYAWYDRPLHPGRFIRRRLRLIGIPYLAWSVAYWSLGDRWRIAHDPGAAVHDLRDVVVWGGAWYHLYFLLVSLQVAVLFPLFRLLVRRTRGRHGRLLAGAAVLQAASLAVVFAPDPLGWGPAEFYREHGFAFFPTYAFFLVAGALAAVHFDAFHRWVGAHTRLCAGVVVAALAVTYAAFRGNMADGMSPVAASNALQPVSLLWGAAVVWGLYALCARWAAHGAPGRAAVAGGVDIAFGIYLVHPMVLRLLEMSGYTAWLPLPPLPATLVLWGIVAGLSGAAAYLIGRSPASLLVGRERRPTAKPAGHRVRGHATAAL